MERGHLIPVVIAGDFGKPRPALIIQSDAFKYIDSITVLPLTSEYLDAEDCRVAIQPTPDNNLKHVSYVMIDKASTIRRGKAGTVMGRITDDELAKVARALAVFLGFA